MTTNIPITLRAGPEDFFEISGIQKFNDGSGYTSQLSVRSGRFSCSGHPFYFDRLDEFTKDITIAYDCVMGKVRLGHIYEQDFVEIEVKRDGHVSVVGFIVQHGPPRQEMRFAFSCDQTFLPDLLKGLKLAAKDLNHETQGA